LSRLLLFRHAESSRDDPALADFDRPLAGRGVRDAAAVGKLLAARGLIPDRILCSSALRTRQTLEHAIVHLPGAPEIVFLDDLYSGVGYLGVIAANGSGAGTLMVIGHNPMIQEAALLLAGGDSTSSSKFTAKYPTAAVAIFDFPTSGWNAIAPGAGHLAAFLRSGDH
jgi:phosphohistidine phosphatase